MKYAVIDIGSNSVRLLVSENGKTIFKRVKITRLAKGLSESGTLDFDSIERTALAVKEFLEQAKDENVDKTYAFATAGVRQAKNGKDFTDKVQKLCGLEVDVVSGEDEAFFGALGAIKDGNGAVIDVGGASSEIVVLRNGKINYAKSIDVGCVKLAEKFNDDLNTLNGFLQIKLKEYGQIKVDKVYSIGGTATSLCAILLELEVYDSEKVDGYFVSKVRLKELAESLIKMSIEDRLELKGLQRGREEIIASGAVLLYSILEYLNVDGFTASESDNLEGYLKTRVENL